LVQPLEKVEPNWIFGSTFSKGGFLKGGKGGKG
jgi:hypothetical protein